MIPKTWQNAGWLSIEYFFRYGLNLIVGIWLVRYLQPENWGNLASVMAVAFIACSIAGFGTDQIIIRMLVHYPRRRDQIISTAFFGLSTVSILVAIGFGFGWFRLFPDPQLAPLGWALSPMILAVPLAVFRAYYASQTNSKPAIIIQNSVLVFSAFAKIGGILASQSILYFAGVIGFEVLLSGLLLMGYYQKNHPLRFQFSKRLLFTITQRSTPLLGFNLLTALYLRGDQILITAFHEVQETGWYAVAMTWTMLWFFIPSVIIDSFYPTFISSGNTTFFAKAPALLNRLLTGIMLTISILVAIFAGLFIPLLYGESYIATVALLQVMVFILPFNTWITLRNSLWSAGNYERFIWQNTLIGVALGLTIQAALIYWIGARGAAIGLVIVYAFLAVNWVTPPSFSFAGHLVQAIKKPWLTTAEFTSLFQKSTP